MITFNNNPALKEELITKLKHHQDLDTFIQGEWLTNEKINGNGFKGCFYGCTMQTENNPILKFSEKYHIDLWYCYLTEKIFENLPDGEYQKFPLQSVEILPVGFNITKIKSVWFKTTLLKQLEWIKDENIIEVIKNTAALFDTDFDNISRSAAASATASAARSSAASPEWSSARSAARSAAWSAARTAAESSAWSVAESAESAARSAAESAAESARSAVWSSAESVWPSEWSETESAWSAARTAYFIYLRDLLFELIRGYNKRF